VVIRDSSRNTLPVANAGKDLQVDLNANLVLDGSGSSDADGDALAYSWAILSRPAGSTAQLNDADTRSPNFTPDVEGDFVVQLVVSDGQSVSLPDVVMIHDTKRNLAPNAIIVNSGDGITGQSYQLSGLSSTDPNGDPLTYRWSFIFKPTGSSASFDDATAAEPTFTPDVAGSYYISLIVNDGVLDSFSTAAVVLVADPAKGSAISVPAGHNLIMLSSVGGDSGTGALVSMEEADLSNTTELFSFHGVSGMSASAINATRQSLVASERDGLFYAVLSESGAFSAGSVITFDPETKTLSSFTNIPRMNVSGHRVRFVDSKLLFHPDGKSMYTYSRDGGTNNAGVLLHINTDASDPEYRSVSVIGEFGKQVGSFPGSPAAPVTDLRWNGDNRLIMVFAKTLFIPNLPAIEFTPSDATDLSMPWNLTTFGDDFIESRTRNIVVEDDSLTLVISDSPPAVNSVTRGGASGFTMSDCIQPSAVFMWMRPNVFILCDKSQFGQAPVLIKTNTTATYPGVVKSFGAWSESDIKGVAVSPSVDRFYTTHVDESATIFSAYSAAQLAAAGVTIRPPEVAEVSMPNYSDRRLIFGGGERGNLFIGDPAVLNDPMSSINDQFVSVLSLDGGNYGSGAIITYDRSTDTVDMVSLGFDVAGYPFGRVLKTTSGDYLFSVLESRNSTGGAGSMALYDSGLGTVTEVTIPDRVRPAISHVQTTSGKIYGLGVNRFQSRYEIYTTDASTLQARSLTQLSSTTDAVPQYELTLDGGSLWAADEGHLYCIDTAFGTKTSYVLGNDGLSEPVRGITFPTAGGDGFIATRESNNAGQGTIQRVYNQCGAIVLVPSISNLTDLPSTALLAASDGFMYYGTDGGKLMKYDESLNTVTEVAAFANTSVVGFLTEDSNGDIVGVLSDGNAANDQIFTYSLATFVTVTKAVPADTPVDVHYPGLIEIN
jgi:hypothetical protein